MFSKWSSHDVSVCVYVCVSVCVCLCVCVCVCVHTYICTYVHPCILLLSGILFHVGCTYTAVYVLYIAVYLCISCTGVESPNNCFVATMIVCSCAVLLYCIRISVYSIIIVVYYTIIVVYYTIIVVYYAIIIVVYILFFIVVYFRELLYIFILCSITFIL